MISFLQSSFHSFIPSATIFISFWMKTELSGIMCWYFSHYIINILLLSHLEVYELICVYTSSCWCPHKVYQPVGQDNSSTLSAQKLFKCCMQFVWYLCCIKIFEMDKFNVCTRTGKAISLHAYKRVTLIFTSTCQVMDLGVLECLFSLNKLKFNTFYLYIWNWSWNSLGMSLSCDEWRQIAIVKWMPHGRLLICMW